MRLGASTAEHGAAGLASRPLRNEVFRRGSGSLESLVIPALRKRRVRRSLLCAVLVAVVGCAGDDFANDPRPATPLELTGVIQDREISVQPDRAGAGPLQITITNQTDEAYAVILHGASVTPIRVGPVQPRDTATIQKTLEPGRYELRAQAEEATTRPVAPADLRIGPRRPESNDRLLLP